MSVNSKNVTALHQDFVGGAEIASSKKGTSKGDPVSMAIYCIEVTLLINMLIHVLANEYSAISNVTAHADDFPAAGNLKNLRRWWSVLTKIGPKFGYYPEPTKFGYYPKPTKTWLAVNKSCDSEKLESAFFRTKLKTTTEVCRQLGGSVGTRKFKDVYIETMNGLVN